MFKDSKGLPFPDPLGILEDLSDGRFIDPIRQAREIKEKKDSYVGEPAASVSESQAAASTGFENQLNRYLNLLEQAYVIAPCPGCERLVESAFTGAYIYMKMEETGKSASEVKDEWLDEIRAEVKDRLANL